MKHVFSLQFVLAVLMTAGIFHQSIAQGTPQAHAQIVQQVQTPEKRKVSKIGLYVVEPIRGNLPEGLDIRMTVPPITLENENQLFPHVSLGTEFGGTYISVQVDGLPSTRGSDVPFKQNVIGLWGMIKGIAHFDIGHVVEGYGSYGIGYSKVFISSNHDDFNAAIQDLGLQSISMVIKKLSVGANFYLSDHVGVFAEAGLQQTQGLFKVGVVFRHRK